MSHETMSQRVRDVGDGLILAFQTEKTTVAGQQKLRTTELYFFRVASQTRYFQEYNALSSINSQATSPSSGYGYLGTTGVDSGDDIFRISTDDWHLMQFGFAPETPGLQVFPAISAKANGNPAQDRTGTGEDITPGTDDRGWIALEQIPDRFDPPAFTERVSFRNSQDGQWLQWAFHNDTPNTLNSKNLTLFFTGRGYKVQPVIDPALQDLMLQMALSRPEDPSIDTIIHQVGGITDFQLGSSEPDDWDNVPDMKRTFNVDDFPIMVTEAERRTPVRA